MVTVASVVCGVFFSPPDNGGALAVVAAVVDIIGCDDRVDNDDDEIDDTGNGSVDDDRTNTITSTSTAPMTPPIIIWLVDVIDCWVLTSVYDTLDDRWEC